MSQESRLLRRIRAGQGAYPCPPQPSFSHAAEQDYRRNNLAEELLKICAETYGPASALAEQAADCLAAATVIYPDVPEEAVGRPSPSSPPIAHPPPRRLRSSDPAPRAGHRA